jgi:hypothetical protein
MNRSISAGRFRDPSYRVGYPIRVDLLGRESPGTGGSGALIIGCSPFGLPSPHPCAKEILALRPSLPFPPAFQGRFTATIIVSGDLVVPSPAHHQVDHANASAPLVLALMIDTNGTNNRGSPCITIVFFIPR